MFIRCGSQALKLPNIVSDAFIANAAEFLDGHEVAYVDAPSGAPAELGAILKWRDKQNGQHGAESLACAALVLSFPEKNFRFLDSQVGFNDEQTLFDPFGIREQLIYPHKPTSKRQKRCFTVDENPATCLLVSYASYRAGYLVTSVTAFDEMLKWKTRSNIEFHVLIEDMRLQFADAAIRDWSDGIEARDEAFRSQLFFDTCKFRVLLTAGDGAATDRTKLEANVTHLGTWKEAKDGRDFRVEYKPLGGVCAIPSRLGLPDAEYKWPPSVDDSVHAPLGVVELLARLMIERGERLIADGAEREDCTIAAVLATNAAELLRGQEPDLARKALRLRHRAEVLLEALEASEFSVERRLVEIEGDFKETCKHYLNGGARLALEEAATLIGELQQIFTSVSRVEEAEACNRRVIRLLAQAQRPSGAPLSACRVAPARDEVEQSGEWMRQWLRWLARRYVSFLMQGFSRMVAAAGCWFTVLFLGTSWFDIRRPFYERTSMVLSWMLDANVFRADPSEEAAWTWLYPISWLAAFVGTFHLGVLISYLYMRISRK